MLTPEVAEREVTGMAACAAGYHRLVPNAIVPDRWPQRYACERCGTVFVVTGNP